MRKPLLLAISLILVTHAALGGPTDERRTFDRESGRHVEVTVADPYLELHTGPGRGYPVVRVIPRGERIEILFRRTDWFRVRDEHDKEGWARRGDMQQTLVDGGSKLALEDLSHRDYDQQPWEAGALTGNFGGGNVNSLYVGYSFNQNLAAELGVSQALGAADNAIVGLVGLTHSPRPDWRLSPFLEIGTGVIRIQPKATIISPADRTEQVAYWGLGAKWYVSRRFVLRAEYRSYVIFTKLAQNEDRNEWKAGFGFYF